MSLPPRAAAIRGDDYQHIIGWTLACRLLTDAALESISIEDAAGGAFDDIVVRATATSGRPDLYHQVKSGNYLETVIDNGWLTTAKTKNGKSPLQHFHATWTSLRAQGRPFELQLVSNKNFEHTDPILKLIDNKTNKIHRDALDQLSPRSKGGRQLTSWGRHLDADIEVLKDFLATVHFMRAEGDASWTERSKALMRNAGLRDDDDAVARGRQMVRDWVTSGAGPRSRNALKAEVAKNGLLARDGELVLAVHGIDHAETPTPPNAEIDILDLYPDGDPFQRRQLVDPSGWEKIVTPKLLSAKRELEGYRTKRLHVAAKMRLPMYFALGRAFPDVAGWVLSTDQRGERWATNATTVPADLAIHHDETREKGSDLAVAVGLTHDPISEIRDHLQATDIPAGRLLMLSAPGAPSFTSVPSPGWARDWVRQARDHIRAVARTMNASHVHLYFAAPAGIALFLGHDWNLIPTTTVYEHLGGSRYEPTLVLPG